jgi:tetratricopeptide (TPR) repeat protein
MKGSKVGIKRGSKLTRVLWEKKRGAFGVRRSLWWLFAILAFFGLVLAGNRWMTARRLTELKADCMAAKLRGDWLGLERTAGQWAMLAPNDHQPFTMAAMAAQKQGNLARAVGYLLELPEKVPADVLLDLSQLQYEQLHDPLGSIATCQKLLRNDPRNTEAHQRLLFFWAMTRNPQKIREECHRAIAAGGASLLTYAYLFSAERIRFQNALEELKRWESQWPELEFLIVPKTLILVEKIDAQESKELTQDDSTAQKRKDMDDELERLRQQFPENAEVVCSMLERYVERGDQEQVERLLSGAPDSAKKDNRYWRSLGWLRAARLETDPALEAYLRAIQIAPLDWWARYERIAIFRQQNRMDLIEPEVKITQLGKDLLQQILKGNDLHSLPGDFYVQLASLAKACGQADMSRQIEALMAGQTPAAGIR